MAVGSTDSTSSLGDGPMTMTSTEEAGQFLASPLLAGADDGARLAVFRAMDEAEAREGTALVVQGQPNERLWFVIGGTVAIEREQPDGRVDVLATLSGPAIFGTN